MKTPAPAALLIACTYERSPFRPLHWAAADVVAIARALVRHCGFQRVIVLHRRPTPFFTEGETGDREAILTFARLLVPKSGEMTPELAFDISTHLQRPRNEASPTTSDETADLTRLLAHPPTAEQFDSIESLVVAVLNRWLDHHDPDSEEPTDAELQDRRQQIAKAFPYLDKPTAPDPDGIQFRGTPTDAAIRSALIELDSDPATGEPTPLVLTVLSGHGMQLRGRNCFLLPDSHNRFLELTTLPIENLVRWSGSQALFIDACQVPFDATRFPTGRRGPASATGIGTKDYAGQSTKPQAPTGWTLSTPSAPLQGSVALLHTCWPDRPALELELWRQGIGTRCFLEALRSAAWRAEASTDAPAWSLTFEEIARQVYREVRQSSWTLARGRGDSRLLQDPYLLRAGIPEDLVLARTPEAAHTHGQDPRLWIHPPRLDDIHASRPFRCSLGIPFVHLQGGQSLIACWPARNRDFAEFLQAKPGSQEPHTAAGANPDCPCTQVTLADALAFCEWLTRREIESGILPPQGFRYDLPTDGEWDYCIGLCPQKRPPCQIQLPPRPPWQGDAQPEGFSYVPHAALPVETAALLDTLRLNAIPGLRGLAGNVWELTTTPFQPDRTNEITVRGQSFRTPPAEADLTRREPRFAAQRFGDVGFRLVLRRS